MCARTQSVPPRTMPRIMQQIFNRAAPPLRQPLCTISFQPPPASSIPFPPITPVQAAVASVEPYCLASPRSSLSPHASSQFSRPPVARRTRKGNVNGVDVPTDGTPCYHSPKLVVVERTDHGCSVRCLTCRRGRAGAGEPRARGSLPYGGNATENGPVSAADSRPTTGRGGRLTSGDSVRPLKLVEPEQALAPVL
jgi:hypothetical protein